MAIQISAQEGNLCVVNGPNFSGRSELLMQFGGEQIIFSAPTEIRESSNEYVGPDVYNYLSALAPTAMGELRLHGWNRANESLARLVTDLKLTALASRNPFTLSGGEQALLATVCAVLVNPARLALDCCLEQVDLERKASLIDWLSRNQIGSKVMLADNFLQDYTGGNLAELPVLDLGGDRVPKMAEEVPTELVTQRPVDIHIEGVGFGYEKDLNVLSDLGAHLQGGSIYLLEGANGAGKTTFAKLLCGILQPTAGSIRFVEGRRPVPLRGSFEGRPDFGKVSYHFQNPDVQLFSTMVRTEVESGMPHNRKSVVVDYLLRAFDLEEVQHLHPLDLPFVLRKRVALATSIAMGRPWLILDEPTLGQDWEQASMIAVMMKTLATLGVGIIVVSHSMAFRRLFQDEAEILSLRRGRLSTWTWRHSND